MRWLWRRRGEPSPSEGKEMAKRDDALQRQRVIADVLVESSTELAHEHRFLLYANHFGPNAAKALREGRR
jgi:hypothetical protein